MSSLNKLPDGSPSPVFDCTAECGIDGTYKHLEITEWWFEGKKVESIEESAESYFYDAFDKGPFTVTDIVRIR